MLKRLLPAVTILLAAPAVAGTMLTLHVGLASAPTPALVTPTFVSFSGLTGTANHFGFVTGAQNVSVGTTTAAFPMPFSGTIGNLYASLNNATTTHTAAIVDQINGTNGTNTCVFNSAVNGQCLPTGSPSDSFNQGDYFQWEMVANGDTWIQTAVGRIGYTITASGGQHAPLFAVASGATTTGTTTFGSIGNNNSGVATELNVSSLAPTGFTVVGLWGKALSAENTVGHTLTVCPNNSATPCTAGTGIFFNATPSSAVGGCGTTAASGVLQGAAGCGQVNLTSVHFAAGDTISIKDTCASTCLNTAFLMTLDIIPDTTGQVPIFAQSTLITSNASQWAGVSDTSFTSASQTGYQVVPNVAGHVTLSNLIACTAVNPGGVTTRLFNFQSGANPTTVPTTPGGGPVATTSVANGACPGANSATLLAGNQDSSDTAALTAGQTVDTQSISGSGSPALPGVSKVSYVAVVGP